jgi:hypothetical protein
MEFEKMQQIIADVLSVDLDEITPETTFKDDLGADSLDVSLTMEDGTVGRFKLTRIQFHPEGASADFTVSRGALGKDWVVTDLR